MEAYANPATVKTENIGKNVGKNIIVDACNITPTEVGNFICNLSRETKDWLVATPNSEVIVIHIMRLWTDFKMRKNRIDEVKAMSQKELDFYIRIISIPDFEFMSLLRNYANETSLDSSK